MFETSTSPGSARADTGTDVDSDPAAFAGQLHLTRVQAGANVDAELVGRRRDGAGALDGPRRSVESREEAVAGGVDLAPAETRQLCAHEPVVALDELVPLAVAELPRPSPWSRRCR